VKTKSVKKKSAAPLKLTSFIDKKSSSISMTMDSDVNASQPIVESASQSTVEQVKSQTESIEIID
jgi:hypothetical protein